MFTDIAETNEENHPSFPGHVLPDHAFNSTRAPQLPIREHHLKGVAASNNKTQGSKMTANETTPPDTPTPAKPSPEPNGAQPVDEATQKEAAEERAKNGGYD